MLSPHYARNLLSSRRGLDLAQSIDFPQKPHLAFAACEHFAAQMRFAIHGLAAWGNKDANWIGKVSVDLALRWRPFTVAESNALVEILRQPYWSRVWIIQEICVGKTVRIHAGQWSISWKDFTLVLIMMERCMPATLRGLDSNFRAFMEDKIYGLLGLAPSYTRDHIEINYHISDSECYTRVMFTLLEQSRDLSSLIVCNSPSFVHKELSIPSWVPDWSFDASNLPLPGLGLSESNPYHSSSAAKKAIYEGYRASGDSECPTPTLHDRPNGSFLVLEGMVTMRLSEVAPAMELHHRLLYAAKDVSFPPRPPVSWDDFVAQYWARYVWSVPFTYIVALLILPWNLQRTGAALDVLLVSARLAQSPGTYVDEEHGPLKVFFITMMKGHRGHEFIRDKFKDIFSNDVTHDLTNEFQWFQNGLRWNALLKLIGLLGIQQLFPAVYHLVLGFNWAHRRGMFYLRGYVIGLLYLASILWEDYIPISPYVFPPLLLYGLYTSMRPIFEPITPKRIDTVLSAVLEYRLARTLTGRNAQVGDCIALFKGSRCPFVVRSRKSKQWMLVGDAFVYGMMDGEQYNEEACGEMEFV